MIHLYNNQCAIGLEVFVPEDNIINSGPQHTIISCIVGYPTYCLHEEYSFNYMFSNMKGVQAPCPLCSYDRNYRNNNNSNANKYLIMYQQ